MYIYIYIYLFLVLLPFAYPHSPLKCSQLYLVTVRDADQAAAQAVVETVNSKPSTLLLPLPFFYHISPSKLVFALTKACLYFIIHHHVY